MQLTQDDFERHMVVMWKYESVDMMIGYSLALLDDGLHQDCMFLVDVLVEKEKLT